MPDIKSEITLTFKLFDGKPSRGLPEFSADALNFIQQGIAASIPGAPADAVLRIVREDGEPIVIAKWSATH